MSCIDDLRELFQDLIAPELRAQTVRVEAFEKRMDERFETLDRRMSGFEKHLSSLEGRVGEGFKTARHNTHVLEQHVNDRCIDMYQRLGANQAQTIRAIRQPSDYYGLAKRVVAIEERAEPRSAER